MNHRIRPTSSPTVAALTLTTLTTLTTLNLTLDLVRDHNH